MRSLVLPIFLLVFVACKKSSPIATPVEEAEKKSYDLSFHRERINQAFGGYLAAVPPRYEVSETNYPLLVFLHGVGQMGNGDTDLELLLIDGIGRMLDESVVPSEVQSGGRRHSFIIISPQYNRQPVPEQVTSLVNHITNTFRVDTNRIYLSGLSSGGVLVTETASRFPSSFAAIVPIAGVMTSGNLQQKCERIAASGMGVWSIHNSNDPTIRASHAEKFVSLVNSFNPRQQARLSLLNESGHDAWSIALKPDFRREGMNIYEWLLQFTRER